MQRLTLARLKQERQRLQDLVRTLNAVSPLETIGRGYAVVTSPQSGRVISSIGEVAAGQTIRTQLSDGSISSVVESCDEDSLITDSD